MFVEGVLTSWPMCLVHLGPVLQRESVESLSNGLDEKRFTRKSLETFLIFMPSKEKLLSAMHIVSLEINNFFIRTYEDELYI